MACGCLFYFLAALVYKTTAFSNNSYLITFPSTIRPGMTVDVNILILRTSPSDANVSVTAKFFIASRQVVSGVGLFRRGELGSIKLEIPMNESNQNGNERYVRKNIRVIGSGGLTFNETKSVNFDVKGLTIYIQTDKGIYKPGQTVHIRVIPVYPSLKIYHGRMTITVYDSKSNKLRLWKDVASSSGVVSKDFELSSQPNFGDWKIKAEVEGQSNEVSFEVKEYVLPKFEVKVLTNGYATKGNGDVRGTVTAKYTHGKNVKGKGTLSVHFTCHQRCKKFQLDFTVDGSYSFVIPKDRIESIYPTSFGEPYNYGIALTLNASVTEILTQKTYYGEALVRLYRSAALLDYPQSNPRAFKPGFPLQVLIKVQRPDGSPLVNTVVPVTLTINPGNTKYSRAYTSDKNGYVMMTQTLPVGATYIYINAKVSDECGEESSMYQSITRFTSDSKTYIAVTAEFNELNVGSEILLKIKSTEALSSFNYIVLSRGLVVKSGTVAVYPMATRATLKFRATTAMAPSAKIVVYFIRDDGEVVADSTALKINGAFENDVSVQFSRAQTKPGEAVSVKIKASPFSQVSVLAIDKSVLLLDKGNDLTVTEVMNDLASFGGDHSNYFPPWWRWRRRRSFFPWYPRATDSFQIFQSANLAIVTDCKINERLYIMYRTMESRPDVSLSSMRRIYHSNTKNTQPLAEVKKVRTLFPETWLWKTVTTDSFGNARLDSNSPDTITSWVLSGFAVSNLTGFGVANEKQQLRVFQPFFISMDLPYSVVRGEEVAIRVVVFNYNNEDAEVTVTLKGSNDWSNMIETTTNNIFMDLHRNDVKYVLKVLANNGAAVSFPIVPSKLGNIPITVRAQTAKFADGVTRTLLVEPEGVEQEYSYSLLIDLNSTESFNKELELALPSNLINGSAKAAISVIGDIMGSSINGIEKLLRMPYGCGEQNMINFAPSMFIRAYLETVDQLTSSIREKSVRYMTSGYQRELSYQHSDGSYSAFGERRGITRPGSLWLTAFVVKSFSRARSYIYIDPRSLNKSMTFILNNQERNGEFRETGSVGSYLQGGLKSSSPEALTAYVLVSLLESGDQSNRARRAVASTVRYLKSKLQEMTDVYTLALVAYAFELADDVAKEVVLNRLTVRAIREDGTLHWEEEKSESHQGSPWRRPYYRPRSADIEITSYILLVYAHRRDVRTGLPIAQWLAQQRNSLGGYSSTQDTVIGLQALSQFAPLVFSSEVNFVIDLRLSARASYEKRFHVDKSNLVVLQQEELPIVGGKVFIAANGTGIGVLQVGVTYNIDKPLADNSFEVFVTVKASDNNVVKAQPCVQYIGHGQESGMAILEFGLPSGFSLDQDEANRLLNDQSNKIKRVENPGRKAILYFDKIPKSEKLCVDVKSVRTHAVGKAQPVAVVIYDYYRPEKRSTTMYSTQNDVSVCDVCAECTHCNQRGGGHATRVVSFTHLVILVLTIFLYNI